LVGWFVLVEVIVGEGCGCGFVIENEEVIVEVDNAVEVAGEEVGLWGASNFRFCVEFRHKFSTGPLWPPIKLEPKGQLYRRGSIGFDIRLRGVIFVMVKIPDHQRNESLRVFVLSGFGIAVNFPSFYVMHGAGDCVAHCVVVACAVSFGDVVVLQCCVVVNAEGEVDGLVLGRPAIDDGVLVQAWAGFDHAEAGGIWIEPSLEDIRTFIAEFIRPGCLLSVDIETAGQRITCIGFGPRPDLAIVIPFDDDRRTSGCYWPTRKDERDCWNLIREVLEDGRVRKLFQNGAYDIAFLLRAYGIKTVGAEEDTMLLSHALQPESLKGLGYLGSIYSDEGSWKGMRKKAETIKKDN